MYSHIFLATILFFALTAEEILSLDINHSNGTEDSNPIQKFANTYCYINSQCGSRQRCLQGVCQCQPNYKNVSNTCVTSSCRTFCGSNRYDSHRHCDSYDNCVCDSKYTEDPYTQVCSPQCRWNSDCLDRNAFCFSGECKCRSGYRKDTSGTCQSTYCYTSSDCYYQLHDLNTHCSFHTCVCDDHYYLDSNTQICTKNLNPWVWAWACIFIPLAIIICVIYCIRRRRHCHNHSDVHVYQY